MKLENQVCSLDLAKQLKELGVKQESLFYWYWCNNLKGWFLYRELTLPDKRERFFNDEMSAFTVAELGEMLPRQIERNGINGWSSCQNYNLVDDYENGKKLAEKKKIWYWECGYAYTNLNGRADTEANARAKMLVYLLENKLIQP